MPRKPSNPTSAPPGSTILVVDDDLALRDSLKLLLTLEGFVVSAVGSMTAALAVVENQHVDLILTDHSLTAGDTGTELIQRIRQRLGRAIPAVILTADDAQERVDEAQQLGCRLLRKPVSAETLLTTLVDVLIQAQQQPSA